ncbi:MAG: tetratricopeptide repeat protein [Thermomonas haemolytica]
MSSDRAIAVSQTLSQQQTKPLEAALGLFRRGDHAAAAACLHALLAQAPATGDAHHLLALCMVQLGDVAQAQRAFAAALALLPEDPPLLCNFATFLRRQGQHEDAIALWRRAVLVSPTLASAWVELGLTELDLGRLPQAQSALERALSLAEDDTRAWQGLAAVHRAAGRLPQARMALERALRLAPRSPSAWINLGAVCRLLGDSAQALACYQQARALGYVGPELADALAGALLDLGQVEAAIAQARETVQAFPGFAPGHLTLAHLRWEYDANPPDPLLELEQAADANPRDLALQAQCIGLLLRASRTEAAVRRLHVCAAHWGGDLPPPLQLLQAEVLEQSGQWQEAAAIHARLHRQGGAEDPAFLNAHARHLLRQRQPDAVAVCARQALAIDPRNQEAWAYLGTAWRLLDDPRVQWLCDPERLIGVIEIEPPSGYADLGSFLSQLQETLSALHRAVRAPVQQSLRTGSQTPGRLFGRPDPLIKATEQTMRAGVQRWLQRLPEDPTHPFLRERCFDVRFTGSWSVRLRSSGRHVSHIHPEGWMSSAFYVALPSAVLQPSPMQPQAGSIQFGQPPEELALALPPTRVIVPRPGQLVLFPSYFWHGTVPFEDVQPRLTIAFDMVPVTR